MEMLSPAAEPCLVSGDVEPTTFNLRDLGPHLIPFLDSESRLQFRAACREGRAITDRAISTLSASRREQYAAPQPAAQFIAFVRSVLSCGSRPDKLIFHPNFANPGGSKFDANTAAACETLAVFTQHRQALQQHQQFGPAVPFLTCLSVCDMAFTDALASAVHSAAPLLASLTIESDLSSQAALAAATPGLCRLITTCAPSLTSLTFSRNLPSVPQPVADAIAACTSLQHLQVCVCSHAWYPDGYTSDRDSVLRVATVGAALSSLRSLNFQIFSMAEKEALEECLEPMGHATQLTSLCIDSPIFTSRLLTHVLRPLRSSLVRLSLHGYNLEAADLRLLAAEYGQLTYFQFKSKSTGCVPLGLTLMDGARGSVPLPAALRELHLLGFPWAPWDLLALQLPPGLTRLSIDALACHKLAAEDYTTLDEEQESLDNEEEDPDGDGAAGGDVLGCGSGSDTSTDEQPGDGGAGEDASAGTGVGVLPVALPSACPGFNRLLEAVGLLCERGGGDCKGLTLQHDWEPSPRTWPAAGDGHVRLFAALRPLGLRRLELKNCVLEAGDVTALVEQLPELEELSLRCQLHPAVVPLLARLPHLRELYLEVPLGHGTDAWSSSGAVVAAALLPVMLGAVCLQRLMLAAHRNDGDQLEAALSEGVKCVWGQLEDMGRDPCVVTLFIRNF